MGDPALGQFFAAPGHHFATSPRAGETAVNAPRRHRRLGAGVAATPAAAGLRRRPLAVIARRPATVPPRIHGIIDVRRLPACAAGVRTR